MSFKPGLNIVLADKAPQSTDQQTRNGAGKSSLVEIINFIMGSRVDKKSLFMRNSIKDWTFGMSFDFNKNVVKVERKGAEQNDIVIKDSNTDSWVIKPCYNRNKSCYSVSNEKWREILRSEMFKLEYLKKAEAYSPKFRSLFSYFARRDGKGGFQQAIKQSSDQNPYDQQLAMMYFLDLDWTIAQKWQRLRDREKTIKELRKAIGKGAISEYIGTAAELRTRLTIAEGKSNKIRESLMAFNVHPKYHELEIEASQSSLKINKISNENVLDRELLDELIKSTKLELSPPTIDIERLYHEAGIIFPESITRTIEEVREFHKIVINNRKSYLNEEIEETKRRISEREKQLIALSERLSRVMSILNSSGALDQYNGLNSELFKSEAEVEEIRRLFSTSEQMEGLATELNIERGKLQVRLQQEYQERKVALERAILAFEDTSTQLYGEDESGSLTIRDTPNGPEIDINIRASGSRGINNMQIFCFDMMIMQLCIERGVGPGFIIHDSHLFDGTDLRQVASALEIGSNLADRLGFQYIVTMNSDYLESTDLSKTFVKEHLVPTTITDKKEDGGLFGIKF